MTGSRQADEPREGEVSFEDALEELSGIVEAIAGEDCPIDSLEEKVRRAADLIRMLRSRLARTQEMVTEILDGLQDPPETG